MANEQNLKPVKSKSEARERGSKGGIASGKARRDKKLLRDCLEILLERAEKIEIDGKNKNLTGAEILALTAFRKAMNGDIKAMEFVRDTAGQKPAEKVIVADVDPSVIDEVERMVFSDDDDTE
ncbi:MAG: hypothetical protein J6S71_02730 [Clostridia bacterium]|nr:hypothetical protein [Clostridia bacterium]